jgi:hypothetical protein
LLLRKPWNQWLMCVFGRINTDRERRAARILDIDILNDIRLVSEALGKPPTQREYGLSGSHSLSMILRRRKWNEWLMMATGAINYNRSDDARTRRIADSELAEDVRRVAIELGHPPARGEYDRHGRHSSDAIVARKPWVKFVRETCGAEPPITLASGSKATDKELLGQLVRLAKELGRTPLKSDLGGNNGFGWSAYGRAFGTFGNALVKAGLIDPLNRYCVPRQELIDELRRVHAILGHTPSLEEFLANSPIRSNGPIYSEFGSWTQALLAAGVPVVRARNVSADDIRAALRGWHGENNGDDSCLEYWKLRKAKGSGRFPYSCATVSAKFHPLSWEEIMRECGFPNYTTRDPYVAGRKRGNHTGLDGNEYLSSLEKEIGDLLLELRRDGKVAGYEYEAKVCPGKAWTCDFGVDLPDGRRIWLEADGLRRNRRSPYFSGGNEKIRFYADNGMDSAIVSYSSDIRAAVARILAVQPPSAPQEAGTPCQVV